MQYIKTGTDLAVEAGKILMEAFERNGKADIMKQKYFKEDITTTTAAGSYTTMLAGTLYTAAVSNIQDLLDLVIVNNDMVNSPGYGAYKIPIDEPTVAVEVAEGSVVTYFDEGVTSVTVTPRKVVVGTAMTWEITKRGMSGIVQMKLKGAAEAINRKLGTDIVNGLSAGADAGNTVTGGVDYEAIIDAKTNVQNAQTASGVKYGFRANKLVVAEEYYGILEKDTDWKQHVYRAFARPGELVVNAGPLKFGQMEIVTTPLLTACQALVLDSTKAALLIKESDLEVFEGQINGRSYDKEVVALMSYVLAVIYTKAIAKITA